MTGRLNLPPATVRGPKQNTRAIRRGPGPHRAISTHLRGPLTECIAAKGGEETLPSLLSFYPFPSPSLPSPILSIPLSPPVTLSPLIYLSSPSTLSPFDLSPLLSPFTFYPSLLYLYPVSSLLSTSLLSLHHSLLFLLLLSPAPLLSLPPLPPHLSWLPFFEYAKGIVL